MSQTVGENKKKEDEAFSVCLEKIASHGLDMKLVEAQFTFDIAALYLICINYLVNA